MLAELVEARPSTKSGHMGQAQGTWGQAQGPGRSSRTESRAVLVQCTLYNGEDSAAHRLYQRGMISLGLISVGSGELGQRLVQLVFAAGVARDHGRSAGSGVALGQQVTDDSGIVGERGCIDGVQWDRALHVAE